MRCAGMIIVTCCVALGACRGRTDAPSKEALATSDDQAHEEVRGWLDRVEGKARLGGTVQVVGWVGAERPETKIEGIEILLDGMEIAEATEGIERSDVADIFGKPEWNKAGWEAEVAMEEILPGEHKIEAVARDSSGAKYALRGGRLIVVLDSR